MSTFTMEWLQNTITSIESARDEMPFGLDNDQAHMLTAFKIALASLERERVRHEHAKWSDSTFGCVGPIGPLKHLSKEALEAAAEPDDLSEWADMQFLLWDAQRRAGISDAEITAAMENKLKINMERQWPEPKDGEPRLHIKEPGNSPVTPDGWISCSDRMPEDTKMLLAFSQGQIVAAYWNWVMSPIDYKKYRAFTYLSGNILDDVTHWMPLPEPPEQDGE
ncbi:dATP/dGTP pyrophosphohydrolase domain-containing protein [Escherichia coli]